MMFIHLWEPIDFLVVKYISRSFRSEVSSLVSWEWWTCAIWLTALTSNWVRFGFWWDWIEKSHLIDF